MSHSYEEIRQAVIDILLERETGFSYGHSQYANLCISVAEYFQRKGMASNNQQRQILSSGHPELPQGEKETLRILLWDMFRQGYIVWGIDSSNPTWPWLKVTDSGRKLLEGQGDYFFHDLSSFEEVLRKKIPDIDDLTLLYIKEGMQAYLTGCLLSASVMIGVALEQTFLLLLETIEADTALQKQFSKSGSSAEFVGD